MKNHKEMLEVLMQGKTLTNGLSKLKMEDDGQIYEYTPTNTRNWADRFNEYEPQYWKVIIPSIIVNGRVVVEPVRQSLNSGEAYWFIDLGHCYQKNWSSMNNGVGSLCDLDYLKNGLIFRTEKEADEVRRALVSILMT